MIRHGNALIACALVAAFLVPSVARAAWMPDGLAVSGPATVVVERAEVSDGNNGIIVAWADGRDPLNTVIRAQRVDVIGNLSWSDTGIVVCRAPGVKSGLRIVYNGGLGAIVAWGDQRNTTNGKFDLYAQNLLSSGAPLWTVDGVPVHASGQGRSVFALVTDGVNGAIAAWSDERNGNPDLFAQRLNSLGQRRWGNNGIAFCTAPGEQIQVSAVSDSANGAIFAWWDRRNGTAAGVPWLLVAQRVNGLGASQWGTDGLIVPDSTAWSPNTRTTPPAFVASGLASVILAWAATDQVRGPGIFGQKLSSTGTRQWTAGGVLLRPFDSNVESLPSIASDAAGGACLGFLATVPGVGRNVATYAQRVNASGAVQWGADGTLFARAAQPAIATDALGSSFLTWCDTRRSVPDSSHVYAQLMNGSGVTQWAPNAEGIRINSARNSDPTLVSDASGVFVTWFQSFGSGTSRIYVRRLSSQGLSPVVLDAGFGGSLKLLAPDPVAVDTVWLSSFESATLHSQPDAGFYIDDVTVDGNTVGVSPNVSVPFSPVGHAVLAEFANGTWSEPSITTPAGSYGTIAFPLTFTVDDVRTVLDDLGPFDDTVWRMARWDPAASAYQFAGQGLNTLKAGEGYWLITAQGLPFVTEGKPLGNDSAGVQLPEVAGWCQIGNPYRFPIADTALRVLHQGTMLRFRHPENVATDSVLWEWSGSGSDYESVRTLQPRRAYWVRKPTADAARLVFPNWSSVIPVPVPAALRPEGSEWALGARARQGDRVSTRVLIGQWASTTAAPLRVESPPDAPGRSLSLRLVPAKGGKLLADFSAGEGPFEWTLELRGADAPGEVALEWSAEGVPDGLRLWLVDEARGWSRELRAGEPLTMAATAGTRRLAIRAAFQAEHAPSGPPTTIDAAYPNPFRERVGLALRLAQASDVRLAIFDLQGRRVRDLGEHRLLSGEHVLVWDGADAAGRATPPGVYLARIEIGGTRETRRLLRVR